LEYKRKKDKKGSPFFTFIVILLLCLIIILCYLLFTCFLFIQSFFILCFFPQKNQSGFFRPIHFPAFFPKSFGKLFLALVRIQTECIFMCGFVVFSEGRNERKMWKKFSINNDKWGIPYYCLNSRQDDLELETCSNKIFHLIFHRVSLLPFN
jgi:hypothetical protein